MSCERTFNNHTEPDTETCTAPFPDNQIKQVTTFHPLEANSHMNCHPSASPSPGLEVSLFPRTTADSAKQFCSCSKNREKRVHEHSHLTHKAFCFRQWSLHNVYQYIHITSPVGNASAVEAFSSGLISAKTRSATSNGFCCIF